MNSATVSKDEFDLLPDPRILKMLGEINLAQWRCLAELIDNSVDAFLGAKRAGHEVQNPDIHISVPTSDTPSARVTITDNAPGMDPQTLERAVRAGWTNNDPINNLGLFGMGFNIATARLGAVTKVWTTRSGDAEWHGLEIDFDTLIRQKHFRTPRLSRQKTNINEHGTEITIERLKPEQRVWLSRSSNRTKMVEMFETIYSSMLRPNGVPISFGLRFNSNVVTARSHCIWGGEGSQPRQVTTSKYGVVSAYQPFQSVLQQRAFCIKCWQWLAADEPKCPACDSDENVVVRDRGVHGWVGIQRYLSDTEFGLDLVRNGRKIETACKDLFSWDAGGKIELEYPIDDPRNRGRIVGEIHLDHCRVTYTKDRFDRNDPAWDEMVKIVRGPGPLRPDRASELGFGPSAAPLFLLFQAFRRNNPHTKVAGAYAKLLVVKSNDDAVAMSKRFYAGEAEFQSDKKWWDLVEEADRELLVPPKGPTPPVSPPGFGPTPTPGPTVAPPPQPAPARTPIASLSKEYRETASGLRWDVKAFHVEATDPSLGKAPWALKALPVGSYEFFVSASHSVFRSATLTPLDALLAELAWSAMDYLRSRAGDATFSGVLASLRTTYATASQLDGVALSSEAAGVIAAIARSVKRAMSGEDGRILFNELTPAEQDYVHQKMAARGIRQPQKVINEGQFLEFAQPQAFLRFFQRHPEVFLDGRYWDDPYTTIEFESPSATEAARAHVVEYYMGLLRDAVWLTEQGAADLEAASRQRLLRASLAIELLAPNREEPALQ